MRPGYRARSASDGPGAGKRHAPRHPLPNRRAFRHGLRSTRRDCCALGPSLALRALNPCSQLCARTRGRDSFTALKGGAPGLPEQLVSDRPGDLPHCQPAPIEIPYP